MGEDAGEVLDNKVNSFQKGGVGDGIFPIGNTGQVTLTVTIGKDHNIAGGVDNKFGMVLGKEELSGTV